MKTYELYGRALDWAVSRVEGVALVDGCIFTKDPFDEQILFSPSTDWSQGGPIIHRERICLAMSFVGSYGEGSFAEPTAWSAYIHKVGGPINPPRYEGPTPLVAAMRAFVASKLGEYVDVPDELAA